MSCPSNTVERRCSCGLPFSWFSNRSNNTFQNSCVSCCTRTSTGRPCRERHRREGENQKSRREEKERRGWEDGIQCWDHGRTQRESRNRITKPRQQKNQKRFKRKGKKQGEAETSSTASASDYFNRRWVELGDLNGFWIWFFVFTLSNDNLCFSTPHRPPLARVDWRTKPSLNQVRSGTDCWWVRCTVLWSVSFNSTSFLLCFSLAWLSYIIFSSFPSCSPCSKESIISLPFHLYRHDRNWLDHNIVCHLTTRSQRQFVIEIGENQLVLYHLWIDHCTWGNACTESASWRIAARVSSYSMLNTDSSIRHNLMQDEDSMDKKREEKFPRDTRIEIKISSERRSMTE